MSFSLQLMNNARDEGRFLLRQRHFQLSQGELRLSEESAQDQFEPAVTNGRELLRHGCRSKGETVSNDLTARTGQTQASISWRERIIGIRSRSRVVHSWIAHDPCRLVRQVKQFGGSMARELLPLPASWQGSGRVKQPGFSRRTASPASKLAGVAKTYICEK